MANKNSTSFDIDVDESEVKKPVSPPIRKSPPKPKVHSVEKIIKVEPEKKDPPKDPPQEQVQPTTPQQVVPSLEVRSHVSTNIKVPSSHHESVVVQPPKENNNPFGTVDPVVAAVVGTAVAAAAAGTAVTTGIATPAITAVKAGLVKAKMALGLSSKAAVVAGTAAVAGAAMVILEKKFTDYEKDIQSTKEDVDNMGDQLKRMDEMLNKITPKS
jgi:hypothetical protein